MNQLRLEADESSALAEELKAKVKTLEQENLAKEQEITTLSRRVALLEEENETTDKTLREVQEK